MLVEKMAEWPVPHVMQQAGQAHQRLDVSATRNVGANVFQARIQGGDGATRQVHHAEDVLKSRVLRRGIDPPGRLQLMNLRIR